MASGLESPPGDPGLIGAWCSRPIFITLASGVVPRMGPTVLDLGRGCSVSGIPTSRALVRDGLPVREIPVCPRLAWWESFPRPPPGPPHVQPWHPVLLRAPQPPPTLRHIGSGPLSQPRPPVPTPAPLPRSPSRPPPVSLSLTAEKVLGIRSSFWAVAAASSAPLGGAGRVPAGLRPRGLGRLRTQVPERGAP